MPNPQAWSTPFTGPEMKALRLPGDTPVALVRIDGSLDPWRAKSWSFDDPDPNYRLPADHPAVAVALENRKLNSPGKGRLVYWPGGEKAPEDWDGGPVLLDNGATTFYSRDCPEASGWLMDRRTDPVPNLRYAIAYLPRAEEPAEPKRKPRCDTCGKDVAEVLCSTCAKWWADNPPPADTVVVPRMTEGEWIELYQRHGRVNLGEHLGIIKPDPVEELLADFREGSRGHHTPTARAAIAFMLEREGRAHD